MKNRIIIASLLAVIATTSLTTANAEKQRKGPRGKPPVEAFDACASKSAQESCSFTSDRGDITGMCKAPPRGGEGPLACAPERGAKRT